jgi:Rrf2 family transcriptional regulator, iron-sulfur cluster assembly transcription factor
MGPVGQPKGFGVLSQVDVRNASTACRQTFLRRVGGVELNTKGRYAVMAMADIAHAHAQHAFVIDGGEDAVPLSAIAERQHISLAYLEQIFGRLRRAGLVESARGRAGGYRLSRPAADITVAEIMTAVDEGVRMTRCQGEDGLPCLPGERCITHGLWDALGTHITTFLSGVTLQNVIEGGPARGATPAPDAVFSGGVVR